MSRTRWSWLLGAALLAVLVVPMQALAVGPVVTCTAAGTYGYYFPPSSDPRNYVYVDGQGSCVGGKGPYAMQFSGRGSECLSIDVITGDPCGDFGLVVTVTLTNVVTGSSRTLAQGWSSVAHAAGHEPFVISSGGIGAVDFEGDSNGCPPAAESGCTSAYYVFSFLP